MPGQRAESPPSLHSPEAARHFFASRFSGLDPSHETLFVAHLDPGRRLLHLSSHAGDERGIDVPIRAILADALRWGSRGLLLAHNHPSGDCTPSASDCRLTRRLARAGEAMDLAILDHFVFAGPAACRSFRHLGLL